MKRVLSTIAAICIAISMVVGAEHLAKHRFPPPPFTDSFKRHLQHDKPDIILIGNSTLNNNVDRGTLERELTRSLGRKIRATFITRGGTHGGWQFLAMKNQVVPSGITGVPVVFVNYEDYFTKPDAGVNVGGRAETNHKVIMTEDEPEFLSKIGPNRIYYTNGFPYLLSRGYSINSAIVSHWVLFLMEKLKLRKVQRVKGEPRYERTLRRMLGRVFAQKHFKSGEMVYFSDYSREKRLLENASIFAKAADQSFLPEQLAFKDRYPLTFVVSSSNPNMTAYKRYHVEYARRLEEYLTARGAKFIDLNRRPELADSSLMHDSRHFNEGPAKELNTKVLAEELVKHQVLK